MQFQRLTIVRLCSAPVQPPDGPDDERIQKEHIAYLTGLRDQGKIALNGPVRRADTEDLRGLSIYTVDIDEARSLAEADPAVKAGWFVIKADTWWLPSVPVTLGDRVDFEIDV